MTYRRDAVPLANRLVLFVLASPLRAVAVPRTVGLRCRSRAGVVVQLPVESVPTGDGLLVLAGHGDRKTWWRHFRRMADVEILVDGDWRPATARVVDDGDRGAALAAYRAMFSRVPADTADPLVAISFDRVVSGSPQTSRISGWRLWFAWFRWVTVGEAVGFAAPATVGAVVSTWRTPLMALALLVAGAVEGAALGAAQAHVLRMVAPRLQRARFVTMTAIGAVIAYLIGLTPALVGDRVKAVPPWTVIGVGVLLGLMLLATIGTAQWIVIRREVRGAWRWIPATAVAWLVGLSVFLSLTMPLWHEGQSLVATTAVGVAGGLAMAMTVAAITGAAAVRIFLD